MSNILDSVDIDRALTPFNDTLGNNLPKIKGDIKSLLGRIKDEEIEHKPGTWKCSAKCVLTRKDGVKVTLPLNNPAAQLLRFGMAIMDLCEAANIEIVANDVPKVCQSWVTEHSRKIVAPELQPA